MSVTLDIFPFSPRQGGEGRGEGVPAANSHIDRASTAPENPLTPALSPFQGAKGTKGAP